ncbi:MAG: 16S rRNA (adenine(1518)-N(6)/adenine(1519)-N(6))-dimethyltransferase RsmA [Firmicutes bacterium]|nr:16S rRNA (adenine(1518)-N(6)/adenine(1519)-N(6))-dimethyltransferase RsmA [Bacillota bacterium]
MPDKQGPSRLTSPVSLNKLLRQHGLAPRHHLGQNFLVEPEVLKTILAAADLSSQDVAIEVGPGLGVLTRVLARSAGEVIALELDPGLLELLKQELQDLGNVHLVQGDALKVDLNALLAEHPPVPPGRSKVVANLPYYITTPFLMRLLEEVEGWERAVLMVQREVADRLLAPPGNKSYGVLSLAVQYHAQCDLVAAVGRKAFWPAPEVDSAVVRLTRREQPPVTTFPRLLFAAVRAAFGQRRKTLGNALGARFGRERAQAALQSAGIDAKRRGETLSLEEFARVAEAIGSDMDAQP